MLSVAILAAGIAFLLTPLSAPLWNHAPEAAFLQFPWRLLAVLAPVFALAVAATLHRFRLATRAVAVIVLLMAATLALPAYHLFDQPCDEEDAAAAQYALFQSHRGTEATDEYTPSAADNDALKPGAPPFWLANTATADPPDKAYPGPAPAHLTTTAPRDEYLVLNLRDYPAWQIVVNGRLDPDREQRNDGRVALPVEAGDSTVDIRYARTTDEVIGDSITLLAALTLILFTPRNRARRTQAN